MAAHQSISEGRLYLEKHRTFLIKQKQSGEQLVRSQLHLALLFFRRCHEQWLIFFYSIVGPHHKKSFALSRLFLPAQRIVSL